jgi:hypothetical protein
MFKALLKASVAVIVSPVMVCADVLTLPASAYANKSPFAKTGAMLNSAAKNLNKALN